MIGPLAILLLLAGCNEIYGLERTELQDSGPPPEKDAGIDALIDAQPPSRIVFKFTPMTVCQGKLAAGSVYLNAPPVGSLVVTIASADPAVVIEAPQAVMFGASNWNSPQTLTARGVSITETPISVTASAPGENTVHDGLVVTGPC